MNIQQIANELVKMNRDGLHMEIYDALYDTEAVESIEPDGTTAVGREAIEAKGAAWHDAVEETHSLEVSDPLVATSTFAVTFTMDVTIAEDNEIGMPGGRSQFTELAVYHVNDDGKIVKEEFLI